MKSIDERTIMSIDKYFVKMQAGVNGPLSDGSPALNMQSLQNNRQSN